MAVAVVMISEEPEEEGATETEGMDVIETEVAMKVKEVAVLITGIDRLALP